MKQLAVAFTAALVASLCCSGIAYSHSPCDVDLAAPEWEQELVADLNALMGGPPNPGLPAPTAAVPGLYCGTPVIWQAIDSYASMSPWAQRCVADLLELGESASSNEHPMYPGKGRAPRPGHDTPYSYQSEHFNIKWGTIDPPEMSIIEELAEDLETSWQAEVEQEGYPAPTSSDDYFVDIYIGNTGADGENVPTIDGAGAYTAMYYDGDEFEEPVMSYIVYHPDVFNNMTWAKAVSAHEFFHVLQAAIWVINYPYHYGDPASGWWIEATANWMVDVAYPDINDYVNSVNYYMSHPEESLHDSRYGYPHSYAMCVWAKYLSENHGGNQVIYDLWIEPDPDGILWATDKYLAEVSDMDLKGGYADFLARVATKDFEEGSLYDDVALTDTVDEYPYNLEEDGLNDDERPRMLGANFFQLLPSDDEGDLLIGFDGQDDFNGNDMDWNVMVLGIRSLKSGYDVFDFQCDDEKEQGSLVIQGFGDIYDEVWIAPSIYPGDLDDITRFSTKKGLKYSLSVEIVPPEADDDDSGGDDDDDDAECCG